MKQRLAVRLYNGAQRIAQHLGRAPTPFVDLEESLLERAREATGLDDFGDESFREPLRVLLRAYDAEARLTPFGRRMVRQELTRILESRLVVEHAWRERPEVLDAPIRRPLFILGLPRTGTTALHFLLAQDAANQVLEYWLAVAPGPRPPMREWKRDPRYQEAVRGLRFLYNLDPSLKAIHLMTADGPEECRHLLQQSFLDDTFDSNATIPSYTEWFAQQDLRLAYARHRDILKLIGSTDPDRRWVLKYPAHLRNLSIVFETYPDACIVQTHRDPVRVLPSICSLVAGWRSLFEGRGDARAIGRRQLDMWPEIIDRGMAARARSDPARFFDLQFAELVADPVGAVARAYEQFGFELSAEAERGMRAWHAANHQGQHGEHGYSPERFGLSEEEMAGRFAKYTDRFQIPKEAVA